jgi:hypothetical protein
MALKGWDRWEKLMEDVDTESERQVAAAVLGRRGGRVSGKRRWAPVGAEARREWSLRMHQRKRERRKERAMSEEECIQQLCDALGVARNDEVGLGKGALELFLALRRGKRNVGSIEPKG